MALADQFGVLPLQSVLSLMSLIPKPASAGERSVARTAMLYRLWCKLTGSEVKSWQLETLDSWDGAAAGKRVFD